MVNRISEKELDRIKKLEEERELEIARWVFPDANLKLEDLDCSEDRDEKVFVNVQACPMSDEDLMELFKLCYKEFGESREHCVHVYKGAEGFYFTTDDEESLGMNEQEWVGTFCYFVMEVDEYTKTKWYPEYFEDVDYEYYIEFDQYE